MADYVAVDLETTGLEPKKDKIIEIGALRVVDGRVEGIYETFVNPYRKLSEQVKSLTGIQDGELEPAPGIEEVLEEFLAFAGDLPLLGHHVIFDYSFLKRAAVNQGCSFERMGIDTLKLARRFMPEEEKKTWAMPAPILESGRRTGTGRWRMQRQLTGFTRRCLSGREGKLWMHFLQNH